MSRRRNRRRSRSRRRTEGGAGTEGETEGGEVAEGGVGAEGGAGTERGTKGGAGSPIFKKKTTLLNGAHQQLSNTLKVSIFSMDCPKLHPLHIAAWSPSNTCCCVLNGARRNRGTAEAGLLRNIPRSKLLGLAVNGGTVNSNVDFSAADFCRGVDRPVDCCNRGPWSVIYKGGSQLAS